MSAAQPLAQFQRHFAAALLDESAPVSDAALAALRAQPAFAVYRNTVMKGCIDALEANYPSVTRLVGREWFRSAAALYVAAQPPDDARLLYYGRGFAQFLHDFPPAAELSYLAGVARLDRCWTESHAAADAPPLDAAEIARLTPEALGAYRLHPHPAARWAWFAEQPIYTLWRRNREALASEDDSDIPWQAEGALLTRVNGRVCWQLASAADCAFLSACAQGQALTGAVDAALHADESTNFSALLTSLLQAGAFQAAPDTSST